MERISVIVPIYKVEAYLDKCVQSIVNQTYTQLEIILVDDGSPDGCGAMCEAWAKKDARIKVLHKENGGLSDARNAGLAVATGEYIAFVDSDDWVSPEYISAMYRAMQDTGAEIAGCDVCTVFPDEDPPLMQAVGELRVCSAEDAIKDILRGIGFRAVAWNKLYRKALLEGECYPVGKYHEDEFFTYRICGKATKLAYIDQPMYFYLQRQGSIMSSFSIKRLDALDAYMERLDYLEKRYPELYRNEKFSICLSCAMFYCRALRLPRQSSHDIRNKIKRTRKRIRISRKEYKGIDTKKKVYAIGTDLSIGLFCRLLNLINREM